MIFMEIQYTTYDDKYYNDLKAITLTSFKLTSFNTDRKIPLDTGNQVAWELWCKPVLKSDKKKYCIVASAGNKAVAYIIYGVDIQYSRLLKLKIGSIILMAVDNKFQGDFNIARNLLKSVLNIYNKYQINVVTAGTDQDNLPAMINYINGDFKPILFWSTYRYYFKKGDLKRYKNIKVIEKKKIKSSHLKNSSRPVSFFMDRRFDRSMKRKIDSHIRKKILTDLKKEKLQLFELKFNKKSAALFSVIKEKSISKIINIDIYRINDIIFFQKEIELNTKLLHALLEYLIHTHKTISIIETFVRSNDWWIIEALIKAGFIPIHNAVTLHKFL